MVEVAKIASAIDVENLDKLSKFKIQPGYGMIHKGYLKDLDQDPNPSEDYLKSNYYSLSEEGVRNTRYYLNLESAKSEIIQSISQEAPEQEKAQKKSNKPEFDIFSTRGQEGYWIGKKIATGKYVKLGTFDTVDEAKAYRSEHADELRTKFEALKEVPNERKTQNRERVGEDYRKGRDISPQEFIDTFGFRGVQFGNYVEQQKRQDDLNNAYDGFMDLAKVLDVPPRAMSLTGKLAIAFGARGSGGKNPAKAHYESHETVINMTKNNGAGSLAHEWFHAMDNVLGKHGNEQKQDGFVSETKNPHIDTQTTRAWESIKEALSQTELPERSTEVDSVRTKDYWSTTPEMLARSFEKYVIQKLSSIGTQNDYLANIVDEQEWKSPQREEVKPYVYPTDAEMKVLMPAFDFLVEKSMAQIHNEVNGVQEDALMNAIISNDYQAAMLMIDKDQKLFQEAHRDALLLQSFDPSLDAKTREMASSALDYIDLVVEIEKGIER